MSKISIGELTAQWGEKMSALIAKQREFTTVSEKLTMEKEIQANAYYKSLLPKIAAALCEERGLDAKDFHVFGPYAFGIFFCDLIIGHEDPLWLRIMLNKKYDKAKDERVYELVYETGESSTGDGLYYVDGVDRKRELKSVPDSPEDFLKLMRQLYADETYTKAWLYAPPTAQEISEVMS